MDTVKIILRELHYVCTGLKCLQEGLWINSASAEVPVTEELIH